MANTYTSLRYHWEYLGSQLPDVIRYVEGQREHHRRQTFQEEYRALLDRHGVDYDEQYLWG